MLLARYRGQLVVENPATSTPGLAFMLATIAKFGDGWQTFWRGLRANGVLVVDGWEDAYYSRFSGAAGSKGNRPVVVSYASSPPAEVIFANRARPTAPTGVVERRCFRQVELAGVLRGAENEEGARKLIDFMLSKRFQEDVPLQMFVFPARTDAALPQEFESSPSCPSSRSSSRPRRSSRTASAGWTSGRTSWCGERAHLAGACRTACRSRSSGCSSSIRCARSSIAGCVARGIAPLDVLTDPITREVVWFTVWQALASTALTIAIAMPAAYVLGRYRFRGRGLVGAIVVVPFVLPTVVVALAFLAILPDGARARLGADPRRARVLQRRGRRADRRDVLGEPRSSRR